MFKLTGLNLYRLYPVEDDDTCQVDIHNIGIYSISTW